MLLRIISAEWELYSGKVEKVTFPTEQGILGILPWHINIVTPLANGIISYFPIEESQSSLESFTDKADTLSIVWWLAMVENDVITIAVE